MIATVLARSRFTRFLVVGGLNTALGYGVYALLVYLGAGHVGAATLSFCLGLLTGFHAQGRLVFRNRGLRGFLPYVASWLLIYGAYILSLDALVDSGMNEYLAGALLLPAVAILSFAVLRFVVFRPAASGRD